jgi:uncharacterized protein (TIGR03492 family)
VRRLLVISNGTGEDSIGAEIVRRLPRTIIPEAYPTLGEGHAYRGVCQIVGPRAALASEGQRNYRGSIAKDVKGGGLATIPPAIRFLRGVRGAYDSVLVVGDAIGVLACWLGGLTGIIFLDVYNTGYGRRYYFGEKRVMRKVCRTVFCRSQILADQLKAVGIDARAAGNVMMDTIPTGDYDAMRRRLRLKAVTLLPGSREQTIVNFALQVEALGMLPEPVRPDVFVAVAEGVEPEQLAKTANLFFHPSQGRERSDLGRLTGRGLHVHLARGALRPLLDASDVVMSQAGTATIQAIGLGKPVITFARDTVRSRRIEGNNKLYGEARLRVPSQAEPIADALKRLLTDDAERKRLGEIGKERIGPPGVIKEIIATIEAPPPVAATPNAA